MKLVYFFQVMAYSKKTTNVQKLRLKVVVETVHWLVFKNQFFQFLVAFISTNFYDRYEVDQRGH